MDGKGRFPDNIFVERLWRSLKYQCVYPHALDTGSEAKAGVRKWIDFYKDKRPHSALGGKLPALIYWQLIETTNPNQQEQKVAKFTPETGQTIPSNSQFTAELAATRIKI